MTKDKVLEKIRKIAFPLDLAIYVILYFCGAIAFVCIYIFGRIFHREYKIKSKRVLQLGHYSIDDIERQGVSHSALEHDLTEYFEKMVTVIFSPVHPVEVDKHYKDNHRVISIPQQPDGIFKNLGLKKTNFAFSFVSLIAKCLRVAKEERVGLFRAQDPFVLGLTVFLCSRISGIPYSIHVIQNYDISTRAVQRLVFPPFIFKAAENKIENITLRNSIFTTACFGNYKFYAISHGALEENVFSLRYEVNDLYFKDLSSRRDLKKELGLNGRYMAFYAGRLEKVKFVEDLVMALKEIKKDLPNVSLVIAGDGKLKDRLMILAKEFGISDSLILLGRVSHEELVNLYHSSDVILFTHAGITMVEAALSGKPIVAYDHDWAVEFLGYNERGMVAQFRDPSDMARCASTLLKDKELASRLSDEAKDFAAKHFNPEVIKELKTSVFDRFFRDAGKEGPHA